ncbi:contractile injection system tape measure protein [Algoriphagus halophilus]|uniref:contractile injection system tape measure protein n=1 Tax=Algoriphagus halophilus TaxID=226505 RepID=UPI003590270F
MSLIQQHKIHTASLQVQFEGIEEGLGLQDRLALVFHEKVKPALEKEFDQLIGPETTLVIDQLILDCGFITDEDWEEKLLQQVLGQVRKEIASKPSSQTQLITKENKANEVSSFLWIKDISPGTVLFHPLMRWKKLYPLKSNL